MTLILFSIVLFILTGCASASLEVEPPIQYLTEKSRSYNLSFAQTWANTSNWFSANDVIIDKSEEAFGLLIVNNLVKDNESYMDCGKVTYSNIQGSPSINKSNYLEITVRAINNNLTSVTVNFTGSFELSANDAKNGDLISVNGHCISTGKLEKSILDFIVN